MIGVGALGGGLVLMAAALPRGLLMLLAAGDALALGPVLSLAVFGAAEACVYPAAMALDTALLVLAVGCFVQVRPRLAVAAETPAGALARGLREGIAFAWGHGAIRTGLGLIAMINLAVLGPVVIGVVELVTLRFGGGAGAGPVPPGPRRELAALDPATLGKVNRPEELAVHSRSCTRTSRSRGPSSSTSSTA